MGVTQFHLVLLKKKLVKRARLEMSTAEIGLTVEPQLPRRKGSSRFRIC